MKKKLILIASMVMFSVNAMADAVKPFDRVKVNVPAKVKIVNGDDYLVLVESKDVYTSKLVKYTVKDNTLNITLRWGETSDMDSDNVTITIVTPKEQEFEKSRNTEIKTNED